MDFGNGFDPMAMIKKVITGIQNAVYNEVQKGGAGQDLIENASNSLSAATRGIETGDMSALFSAFQSFGALQSAAAKDPAIKARLNSILEEAKNNSGFDGSSLGGLFGGLFGSGGGLKDIFDMFGKPGNDNPPQQPKNEEQPQRPKKTPKRKPRGGDSFDV